MNYIFTCTNSSSLSRERNIKVVLSKISCLTYLAHGRVMRLRFVSCSLHNAQASSSCLIYILEAGEYLKVIKVSSLLRETVIVQFALFWRSSTTVEEMASSAYWSCNEKKAFFGTNSHNIFEVETFLFSAV